MANFKINIKAKDYELTNDIKSLVNEKVSYFEKFIPVAEDEEVMADVLLAKTTKHHTHGEIYQAEISLKYKSEFKHTEVITDDMRSSIEKASEEITRQIRRTKEKRTSLMRRGAKQVKKWMRMKE